MNRPEPPIIANWLLKHLTHGSDALLGDLTEEYTNGRSTGWYWRQVLLAILMSAAAAFRGASLSLGFALLWSVGVTLFWGRYFFPHQTELILKWSPAWYVRFPWPWSTTMEISLLSALATVPLVAGLSVYITISRRFSISRFSVGVALAFLLQVARMLVLPGLLKHNKSFSAAFMFVMLTVTILVGRKPKNHQCNQEPNSMLG